MKKIVKQDRKPAIMDLVSRVSKIVEISSIRLISCSCSQEPGAERMSHIELDKSIRNRLIKDNHFLLVFPSFTLKGFPEEKHSEDEKPLVTMEATFLATYHLKSMEGITGSHIDAFSEQNAVYNVWPYWREFIQSTMSRMALKQVSLPVYRI